MLSFLYLVVLVYGSKSSLQPIKQDNGMHFNLQSVNNNTSKEFISDLMSNDKQFIAEFANLDPVELQRIISLLEDLRTASETRETTLQDTLSRKIDEAIVTGNAVTVAGEALTDAQGVVDEKELDLANARAAHDTKVSEKVAAKQERDDEKPSLDDEQEVLTNVITMLGDLHSHQNPIACTPKNFAPAACTATGINFDGVDDYIVIPPFQASPAMTAALRIKYLSIKQSYERVFDFSTRCGTNSIFPDVSSSKSLTWQVMGSGGYVSVNNFWLVGDGQFHTYVFSLSAGGQLKAYRDGILVGSEKHQAIAAEPTRTDFRIGGSHCEIDHPNIHTSHMELEWAGFWEAALTDEDVKLLSVSYGNSLPNKVAVYNFAGCVDATQEIVESRD